MTVILDHSEDGDASCFICGWIEAPVEPLDLEPLRPGIQRRRNPSRQGLRL